MKTREEILKSYGASEKELQELLLYNNNNNKFEATCDLKNKVDEKFIEVWQIYKNEAEGLGSYNTLKKYMPQLNLPISEGISQTNEYKDVTLRGKSIECICNEDSLELLEPDSLELDIYQTLGGKIPILFTPNNYDFEKLVQALVYRNEPIEIPNSMGACIVKGYNNWDRVRRLREKWTKENKDGFWQEEFKKIIPIKDLYQDKFIILSDKFYSGITPNQVGMNEEEWKKVSHFIRREHECTHYLTQRLYGSMQNKVQDEIIADFFGILEAMGEYKPLWALMFLGLENAPKYRQGGRLENYRGKPPLSDISFDILKKITVDAVMNLNRVYLENKAQINSEKGKLIFVNKLTSVSLEVMADGFIE